MNLVLDKEINTISDKQLLHRVIAVIVQLVEPPSAAVTFFTMFAQLINICSICLFTALWTVFDQVEIWTLTRSLRYFGSFSSFFFICCCVWGRACCINPLSGKLELAHRWSHI